MTQDPDAPLSSEADLLLRYLQRERENLVRALEGLSDFDQRRPMTPSGTNLLGLVKHVATVEIGYLGECVGRPWPEPLPWVHADESVRTLGLDAPATVPWWPEERRETTLGHVLVHLLAETAHHAGHA